MGCFSGSIIADSPPAAKSPMMPVRPKCSEWHEFPETADLAVEVDRRGFFGASHSFGLGLGAAPAEHGPDKEAQARRHGGPDRHDRQEGLSIVGNACRNRHEDDFGSQEE